MAERLRPLTTIPEVAGSNPGPAVAPLARALYPHCRIFRSRVSWCIGELYPIYTKRTHFTCFSQRAGRNPGEVVKQINQQLYTGCEAYGSQLLKVYQD